MCGPRAREGRALTDRYTDRTVLTTEAYADSRNLSARSNIYRWNVTPQASIHDAVIDGTTWTAGQRVLDVGCGPGSYLAHLASREPGLCLTGADLSAGMASEAAAAAPSAALMVSDVQALPFAASTFDRVLAPHMLYHAPDLDRAVGELRRVLRPGGVALVVTNGIDHLAGFRRLLQTTIDVDNWARVFVRFDLDNGATLLRRHFDHVARLDLVNEVAIPDLDAVVGYVASTRSNLEPQLPAGLSWDDALAAVRAGAAADIEATGVFRSRTHAGILTCS